MPESGAHTFRAVTRAPSLSDRVAEELTEAIVSRRLRLGDLLPSERELGDKFSVSRTVVREAERVWRGLNTAAVKKKKGRK